MPTQSRYYMSRVIKIGALTTEKIIAAIQNPVFVQIRGTRYTFTDFRRFGTENETKGIFARLAKYKLEGAVDIVHPDVHTVGREAIENLMEASSPFVYLPEFGGIAYKHVWNLLQRDQFARAFCELIDKSEQNFLGRCELEPVTDLRTFVTRLSKLDKVTVIQAKVRPPNPSFGPCWESLKEYLRTRNLEEAAIKEESSVGISTNVTRIAGALADGSKNVKDLRAMMEPLLDGVGDAALLMAADGYGNGKVVGVEETRTVTIRTSDNQKSFLLDRDPDPEELYRVAREQFTNINDERHLDHK